MFRFVSVLLICLVLSAPSTPCNSKTTSGQNHNSSVSTIKESYDAKATNKSCNYGRGKIIDIGITKGNFTPKIHVCFDNTTHRTFWTKHYLGRTNTSNSTDGRTSWSKDFFYKFNPDKIYKKVSNNSDRGHLSPRADFNTDIERKMTYYYINAAPQASNLNRGKWRWIEEEVRARANKESSPVKVITGSGGVLFAFNMYNYTYPEYFFKIVVFKNGQNEVFVGVNNATAAVTTESPFKQSLCKNVIPFCGCFGYSEGIVYCCKLDKDLMQRFGLEKDDVDYKERW